VLAARSRLQDKNPGDEEATARVRSARRERPARRKQLDCAGR